MSESKHASMEPQQEPLVEQGDRESQESVGSTEFSSQLRGWSVICMVLGLSLALGGWLQQQNEYTDQLITASAMLAVKVGLGLLIAAPILAFLAAKCLTAPSSAPMDPELSGSASAKMFWISFIVLFVEVALIRYCNAQIRIFAFYKNVPLIAAFIGLGLGCFQSQGRVRDVFNFLLWMFPLLAVLSAGDLVIGSALDRSAAIGSSEHILGDHVIQEPDLKLKISSQIVMAVFCAIAFLVISQLFAFLGRILGEVFEELPRLKAYTINIAGSLAGILCFSAISYLQMPPTVWIAVGLLPLIALAFRRRYRWPVLMLSAASVIVVWPDYGETVWSPYQRLVGQKTDWPNLPGYMIRISNVFYQKAADLRPDAIEKFGRNPYPHYNIIGDFLKEHDAGRVLIVASGSGNDVAASLRAGVDHVDAVDIDPAIINMGKLYHPEQPYDDPRVTIHINDARAAFRELEPESYDAVVFGLLDSHTQLGMSSVRLDNYVFTRESFQEVKRLIKPGGYLIVTAASFRDWFGERLTGLVEATTGPPIYKAATNEWLTLIGEVPVGEPPPLTAGRVLPTDNWPYLYLQKRNIPSSYLLTLLVMGGASVIFLRRGGLKFGSLTAYHGHLFFLGAGFLLMEIHAINRLALLFGTTWIVSAVSIALVLFLILLANLTILWFRRIPYQIAYLGLGVTLIMGYVIDPESALPGGPLSPFLYGIILLSPVYFAGLIFARSFSSGTQAASAAIGANILGSVLGGLSEYSSMAFGIRALVLIGMIFYAMSAILLLMRNRSREVVSG